MQVKCNGSISPVVVGPTALQEGATVVHFTFTGRPWVFLVHTIFFYACRRGHFVARRCSRSIFFLGDARICPSDICSRNKTAFSSAYQYDIFWQWLNVMKPPPPAKKSCTVGRLRYYYGRYTSIHIGAIIAFLASPFNKLF